MTISIRDRRLNCFEALHIALATEEAKYMTTTPEMERSVESLYAFGQQKLAQLRTAQAAPAPAVFARGTDLRERRFTIRTEILAMTRAELLVRLAVLCGSHPLLSYPDRDGEALSDPALRQLVENATRITSGDVAD
ncbi:MAG: hypothetical protein H0T46_01780 [Deltaproteobacteria bacterium]|nr:hypothetical protein [Deltaproteobacteria bacterium]